MLQMDRVGDARPATKMNPMFVQAGCVVHFLAMGKICRALFVLIDRFSFVADKAGIIRTPRKPRTEISVTKEAPGR